MFGYLSSGAAHYKRNTSLDGSSGEAAPDEGRGSPNGQYSKTFESLSLTRLDWGLRPIAAPRPLCYPSRRGSGT